MFNPLKKVINLIPKVFFCFFLLSNILSCKKLDFSTQQTTIDRERFFKLPENAPSVLQRIVLNMKAQDSQKPFVDAFIQNEGYPNWQKVTISVPKPNFNSIESTGDTLIAIPIVQNGRQYVRSVLAVKVNAEVWYKLLDGIKYREFPIEETGVPGESFTVAKLFKLMMEMEFKIFGQNNFVITDKQVVPTDWEGPGGGIRLLPYGVQLGLSSSGCTIFNYGYYDTDNTFVIQSSETLCLNETGELAYSLEPPETGGGGGGSGTPPTDDECERGFVGFTDFDLGGIPLLPCPLINDTLVLNPDSLSVKCSREMDSLYQWGITNGFREQSFILVRKNGNIYPKNFLPGSPGGDETDVNYNLAAGEELLAYVHIHAEDTATEYRTSFSAQDLMEFNKHNVVGYTAILEVGNARYAFVVENAQLKYNFNIANRGKHKYNFNQLKDSLINTYPDGQVCTEQIWLHYLGSSSVSGIGFYKATAPNKNTFIKLN